MLWHLYLISLLILCLLSMASLPWAENNGVTTYVGVYLVAGLFMLVLKELGVWGQ